MSWASTAVFMMLPVSAERVCSRVVVALSQPHLSELEQVGDSNPCLRVRGREETILLWAEFRAGIRLRTSREDTGAQRMATERTVGIVRLIERSPCC